MKRRWPSWRRRGVVAAIASDAPEVAEAEAVASGGGREREEAAATAPTTMEDLAFALLVPGAALSYVLADRRRPRCLRWHLDERPGAVVAWLRLHDEHHA